MTEETDTTSVSLDDYCVLEAYVLEVLAGDRELSNAIYELNRAVKSLYPEDLLPAVRDVLEGINSYRWAVKRLLSKIAAEDE